MDAAIRDDAHDEELLRLVHHLIGHEALKALKDAGEVGRTREGRMANGLVVKAKSTHHTIDLHLVARL